MKPNVKNCFQTLLSTATCAPLHLGDFESFVTRVSAAGDVAWLLDLGKISGEALKAADVADGGRTLYVGGHTSNPFTFGDTEWAPGHTINRVADSDNLIAKLTLPNTPPPSPPSLSPPPSPAPPPSTFTPPATASVKLQNLKAAQDRADIAKAAADEKAAAAETAKMAAEAG